MLVAHSDTMDDVLVAPNPLPIGQNTTPHDLEFARLQLEMRREETRRAKADARRAEADARRAEAGARQAAIAAETRRAEIAAKIRRAEIAAAESTRRAELAVETRRVELAAATEARREELVSRKRKEREHAPLDVVDVENARTPPPVTTDECAEGDSSFGGDEGCNRDAAANVVQTMMSPPRVLDVGEFAFFKSDKPTDVLLLNTLDATTVDWGYTSRSVQTVGKNNSRFSFFHSHTSPPRARHRLQD
jgi:hypothetical protein